MQLRPSAVKKYLEQRRDDWRFTKKFTKAQLQEECDLLPFEPPIWKVLKLHQKVYFILGAKLKRFGVWGDTGIGKSIISIALARYFRRAKVSRHNLILVPFKVNCAEWEREIKKHSPNSSYKILEGSSKQKWEILESRDTLLTITTYPGLVRMVCNKEKRKKSRKMRLVPDKKKLKQLSAKFQGLFLDESSNIGNHNKLPFRVCRQIAKNCQILFPLSATPFGRDPTPLWPQMFLVDWGESLGANLGLFRSGFFNEKQNYWSGFPEYHFDKKKATLLNRFLAHRSLQYKADEADLPKVQPIQKYIKLPGDANDYYEKARNQLIAAHGNIEEMRNMFLRMRQISSGFMGYRDDESGEKAEFEFDENPKMEMLLSILESNRGKKTIVFHDFIYSGKMICRELSKLETPIKHVWIRGGVKDPGSLLHRFDNDPDCDVMVLNTAGAFGLNLQVAQYGIFYERPVPVILYTQMVKRFVRQYSKHKTVFNYDLITEETADERIIAFHREGGDLWKAVIEGASGL